MLGSISRFALRTFVFAVLTLGVFAQEKPENAKAVNLTEAQKQTLLKLQADAASKAATVLSQLPRLAKAFNANLLSETPDPELDKKLGRQMADAFSEVIRLRLARIRKAAQVLTPAQRSALARELNKPDAPYLFDDLVRKFLGDPAK